MKTIHSAAMKRVFSCLVSATMSVSLFAWMPVQPVHAEEQSGKCGDRAYWRYEDGTLTIYGDGPIKHFAYTSVDGATFVAATPWREFSDEIYTAIVEENITAISSGTFYNCINLTELRVTAPVQEIETQACYRCESLSTVTLPDLPIDIGREAFSDCKNLITEMDGMQIFCDKYLIEYTGDAAELTVPEGITTICGEFANKNDTLTAIYLPDSVQYIGAEAFYFMDTLQTVSMPDSVERIGRLAFSWCEGLTTVNLSDSLVEIGYGAFNGCRSLTSLVLPDSVLEIGDYAFASCTNLTSMTLPDSLQCIGRNIFDGCTAFLSQYRRDDGYTLVDGKLLVECADTGHALEIPEGTTIIASALWKSNSLLGYTDLYEVTCPESLRTIGAEAFYNCTNLMYLNLNDGLERIGTNALSQCSALRTLTIPASVTEIAPQENCRVKEIYGTPGTAAEQFAQENAITFRDVSELPQRTADMTLDFAADAWLFGNSGEIFGSEYYLTDADRQRLVDLGFDPTKADTAWSGSCVGLSVTVILAKNGVFSPSQLQSCAQSLAELEATEAVQSFINYFQCIQARGGTSQGYEPRVQQFYRMLRTAKNVPNGASPFLLTFATQTGSHAVVGYGMESGEWEFGGRTYDGRILVWDSNFPNALYDESCLYYDSKTFAYCIPFYGVYMAEGDTRGGIIMVCNDLDVLNAFPYPLASDALVGDLNGDGVRSVADAVLLSRILAEDETVVAADFSQADVDADGLWTILDVNALLALL